MSSFQHEPGDTADFDERSDYEALREDDWLEHVRHVEEEKFSRLRDHQPVEGKQVRDAA